MTPVSLEAKFEYKRQENMFNAGTLGEIADGTGGTFIQNTNDLEGGFRRLATAPEYMYMLGFAPENLKPDGTYHALKVKLNSPGETQPAGAARVLRSEGQRERRGGR